MLRLTAVNENKKKKADTTLCDIDGENGQQDPAQRSAVKEGGGGRRVEHCPSRSSNYVMI